MRIDSKIFVAGHRGLVGSAILRRLRDEGYTNIITRTHSKLDLMDQMAVQDFFSEEKPEYVFLAAAKVGGIYANSTYPAEFIYENLMIQNSVIHQSYIHGVKRLLFLGSSCIYPRMAPQPIKEDYLLTGPLEPTNSPYAVSKIAGIEMCRSYNRQYKTQFIPVMPTNLYGPKDNYDLETSHVLPALIRKFHLAKLANKGDWDGIRKDEALYGPIPDDLKASLGLKSSPSDLHPPPSSPPKVMLWGSGRPRREFLHVDDMADACLFIMRLDGNSEMVNIGAGYDVTIRELAELIRDVVGFRCEFSFDTSKPDGTPRKLLDVARLKTLGWTFRVPLRDGIESTYEWYLGD